MKPKRLYHFLVVIILLTVISILYSRWQVWFPWFWPYFMFEFKYNMIGMPMLIPLFYSIIISKWRVPAVVWCVSILVLVPVMVRYHPFDTVPVFMNVALLLIPIAAIVIVGAQLEWRAKQRNVSAEREQERQTYMTQIFRAHEDERSRIAQELHDEAIQTLMVIASSAGSMLSTEKGEIVPALRENLEWTRSTALSLAEDMRRLSLNLRPSILDTMGLMPALDWLVDSFGLENNIGSRLEVDGEISALGAERDVAIFRIVQEALSNVGKHSGASSVQITVQYLSRLFRLSIQDNGIGFTLPESMGSYSREGKIGLLGMQQRARSLGGTLDINTTVGRGTVILAEIPV